MRHVSHGPSALINRKAYRVSHYSRRARETPIAKPLVRQAITYTTVREGGDVLGSDNGRAGSNESDRVLHLDDGEVLERLSG